MDNWKNQLYFGDNLTILRAQHIPAGSVDLIYLDPPFNSNATYNVLFAEQNGSKSGAQITAFDDTWHWGMESEAAFDEVVQQGIGPKKLADLLLALRSFLGSNDMMAYLTMMAVRLVELHRVLKPTGSIFLHCDPTASHYLKLVMDAIFGPKNFRNEISWKRTFAHGSSNRFGPIHDIIFFYSKSDHFKWTNLKISHDQEYITKHFNFVEPETGRVFQPISLTGAGVRRGDSGKPWRDIDPTSVSRHWALPANIITKLDIKAISTQEKLDALDSAGRIFWPQKIGGTPRLKFYVDELDGAAIPDMWIDIPPISAQATERLGYPTQKPEALLERIIKAGSDEGDVVLDPFCGCGTAVAVAERLRRRWIGIDITHLAIKLIKQRLSDTFPTEPPVYEVIGEPVDVKSAEALALEDRYKFEWWALDLVDARPAQDKKKGSDRSIDGVIYFQEKTGGKYHKIIVQVKSGKVGVSQIMELKGAIEREKAVIGAFITLNPPTRRMMEESAAAGFYESDDFPGHRFPRLQILTVADLFAGKKLQYPHWAIQATFKKAVPKRKGGNPEDNQKNLL